MNTILVVVGFVLVVIGHQSRWIFAFCMGCLVGYLAFGYFSAPLDTLQYFIYTFASGVLAALLSLLMRKWLMVPGVFIAGGYITAYLPPTLGWSSGWITLPIIAIAAAVSAAAYLLWGVLPVILVTAALGATLMVQHMSFGSIGPTPMFIIFLLFGILTQWVLYQNNHTDTV